MTVMVGLRHARQILRRGGRPLCRTGIEAWCARHEIDWGEFSGPGIPEHRMAQIDDHYAGVLIQLARKEQADGQQ